MLDSEITSEGRNVRLVISHIGEGLFGDYNPDDSTDKPLLRLDVMRRGKHGGEDADDEEWGVVRNGSFCTQLDANIPEADVQAIADHLVGMLDVIPATDRIPDVEILSWVESKDEALQTVFRDGRIILGREAQN